MTPNTYRAVETIPTRVVYGGGVSVESLAALAAELDRLRTALEASVKMTRELITECNRYKTAIKEIANGKFSWRGEAWIRLIAKEALNPK